MMEVPKNDGESSQPQKQQQLALLMNTKQGMGELIITHNDANPNAPKEQQISLNENAITRELNEGVVYSPNGQYMALLYRDHVSIHDITLNYKLVKCISGEEGNSISQVQFSPLNTFFVTLGKYSPHKSNVGNLVVWKLFPDAQDGDYDEKSCKILLRTKYNKASGSDLWPIVQWNDNESICAIWQQSHQSLNFYRYGIPKKTTTATSPNSQQEQPQEELEEHIPDAKHADEKQFELVSRFKKPKVLKFNLSSKTTFSIHTFNAQSQQHLVQIYRYPNFKKPTCFISFAAEKRGVEVEVDMKWNKIGSALLVHANSSSDNDNENYYGKSQVYFLRSNGHFTCQVTLSQSGPVHDVAWSPKGNEFCLVYGFTPAKATLYNESTQVIYEFGTGTRNKCSWSPNGRFLVLAGFGGLAGRMEFWDREKKRMLGQAEAKEASVYGWSRDSRLFITATVTPTLRVSNKIQLWKYNGVLLHEKPFDTLFGAVWNHYVPITVSTTTTNTNTGKSEDGDVVMEDAQETNNNKNNNAKGNKNQKQEQDKDYRPPSPRAINEGKLLLQTQVQTVKKAYVPPSLRMAGLGPVDDDVFKRAGHEAPSKPLNKKQTSVQQQQMAKAVQLQRMIPGLPTSAALQQVNQSGSNNNNANASEAAKKKRKRKKKKKTTEGGGDANGNGQEQDDDSM